MRYLSEQPPATKTSILGSVQGTGISEELLKSVKPAADAPTSPLSSTAQDENAKDEEQKRKDAENSARTLKYTVIFLGVTMSGLAGFLVATWGKQMLWSRCILVKLVLPGLTGLYIICLIFIHTYWVFKCFIQSA